jgi:hypothetical protein
MLISYNSFIQSEKDDAFIVESNFDLLCGGVVRCNSAREIGEAMEIHRL